MTFKEYRKLKKDYGINIKRYHNKGPKPSARGADAEWGNSLSLTRNEITQYENNIKWIIGFTVTSILATIAILKP